MKTAASFSGLLVPGTIKDTRGDGCNLTATVELFGEPHLLMMLRINDDGWAFEEEDRPLLEDLYHLYEYGFRTVEVPGFAGNFVAVMRPYGY